MEKDKTSGSSYSRRTFLKQGAIMGAGAVVAVHTVPALAGTLSAPVMTHPEGHVPAILGGRPVKSGSWPSWPIWNPETDEQRVIDVLRSGVWSRAHLVEEFEEKWAATLGVKRCLTVVNGTNALIASLVQLGIGGGDEVIVPPYTFIATVIAVLATGAMPVFVDTDPETYQIDVRKIEAKITPRTRAILPVHILGLPADMTNILKIARRHNLAVVEDACQAWLAEIDGKKAGTFGDAGCFSFQNSKNLPIGEGGAIVSDDDGFMDRCHSYHSYGMPYGTLVGAVGAGTVMAGTKLRLTEYQAAIGLAQLARLEEQTDLRNKNAAYLKQLILDIPGIVPYKLYEKVTRAAFHLFPFRYRSAEFNDLPRETFLKALSAEGVPCLSGYTPLNNQPYLGHAFQTKNFQKMYSPESLDIAAYLERNECPENDRLCQEMVWIPQNVLLGSRNDMELVAHAIEKIRKNADRIRKNGN
ncbi:MAG: DegT/DnrJ/EryC1/StrS family aminotransferase [Solitalea sp.]